MKTRNVQSKSVKLKLNKISIINLTSDEMMYVHGGATIVLVGTTTAANTGTGGGGTNTIQGTLTTKTVQSIAPPCTGEPAGPFFPSSF
jgi:hypothetical protein